MELAVPDLLLTLKTAVFSYLLQQCFWGGAQAGFDREERLVKYYR